MAVYTKLVKNRFLWLLLTMFFVVSCSEPSPDKKCIFANDFGGLNTSNLVVVAENNRWVDSGQYVQAGQNLEIYTKGNIDLCPSGVVTKTVLEVPTHINPATGGWQDTGVQIPFGASFTIKAEGWWGAWSDSGTNPVHRFWSGRAVYAALGESTLNDPAPPNTPEHLVAYNTVAPWQEVENIPGFDFESPTSPTRQRNALLKAGTPGNPLAAPPVPDDLGRRAFELFNYKTNSNIFKFTPNNSNEKYIAWTGLKEEDYFPLPAPADKTLWIRFSDVDYIDNRTDTNPAPPAGTGAPIKLTVSFETKCPGKNGQFLSFFISNAEPASGVSGTSLHDWAADPNALPIPAPVKAAPEGNGFYNQPAGATGRVWFKIIDIAGASYNNILPGNGTGDGSYPNNRGSYQVSVTVPNPPFTNIVNQMVDPIKDFLQGPLGANGYRSGGLTKTMYEGFVTNSDFIYAVRGFLALSVIFYGFMYAFGLAQVRQKDLVNHLVKIIVVITVIGPDSWDFFRNHFFTFFIEGADSLIDAFAGAFTGLFNPSNGVDGPTLDTTLGIKEFTFNFFDQTMSRYFSHTTQLKLVALMFSSFVGFFLALCIWFGIILFVFAFFKAVILYLLSVIMISLLLFVTPIFIILLLFNSTRGMFDNWIKNLISFSIQPILLFTCLAIFNAMIYSAFYQVLSFTACFDCLISLDLPVSEYIFANIFGDFDKFCILKGYKIWSIGSGMDPDAEIAKNPVDIFFVFIFLILIAALLKFCDWVVAVGNSITAGAIGTDLTNATESAVLEGAKIAKQTGSATLGVARVGAAAVGWAGGLVGGRRVLEKNSDQTNKIKRVNLKSERDPNKKDILETSKKRAREERKREDKQDVSNLGFRKDLAKTKEKTSLTLERKRYVDKSAKPNFAKDVKSGFDNTKRESLSEKYMESKDKRDNLKSKDEDVGNKALQDAKASSAKDPLTAKNELKP
jgi:type IV secretory pathway VirB6-like protein